MHPTTSSSGCTPSRSTEIVAPAGFEGYFRELVDILEHGNPSDSERAALARRFDLDLDNSIIASCARRRWRHGLNDAPHRVGNVADIQDKKGAHLRVRVLGRTGPAWDVEISFTPAPQN